MPISLPSPPASKPKTSVGVKILIATAVVVVVTFHIVGDVVLRTPLAAAKADMIGLNKYGD